MKSYKNLQSQSYDPQNADFVPETLDIIIEQKVELIVDKEVFLTFYCSPLDLEALAVGFLWNEGIISDLNEIKNLSVNAENSRIDVSLLNTIKNKKTLLRSSSGMSVEDQTEKEQLENPFRTTANNIIQLYDVFLSKQNLHKSAGGFHSAALSDGEIVNQTVEDLGRHNCLDKIYGRYLLDGMPFIPQLILLSGRISSEMIHKILKMNIPVIVSRTTPTTRAVEIAEANDITIIGYLRRGKFSIFSNPHRVLFE